jgi:hypothetical protein
LSTKSNKTVGIHPLVKQLYFTRNEFKRALKGVSEQDAQKRIFPMNCISWNVGHLAWQEQEYFLYYAQRRRVLPEIKEKFAYGAPASTPALAEVMSAWEAITIEVNPWLETVNSDLLQQNYIRKDGKASTRIFGSLLQRVIYHY